MAKAYSQVLKWCFNYFYDTEAGCTTESTTFIWLLRKSTKHTNSKGASAGKDGGGQGYIYATVRSSDIWTETAFFIFWFLRTLQQSILNKITRYS